MCRLSDVQTRTHLPLDCTSAIRVLSVQQARYVRTLAGRVPLSGSNPI
jgi:hypothetical protein